MECNASDENNTSMLQVTFVLPFLEKKFARTERGLFVENTGNQQGLLDLS